jgi:hypothetical protein
MLANNHRRAISIFSTREMAGQAIDRLMFSGFPLAQVFLVGKDEITTESQNGSQQQEMSPSASADAVTGTATGMQKGLVLGNLLGGVTGLVLGMGILALPGVGQIALSSAIAFTLLSGGICTAAGGVIGALIGLGLTSDEAKEYSKQIAQGNFLVIIEGTDKEILLAQRMLNFQRLRK